MSGNKILIVDDSDLVAGVLGNFLTEAEYEVSRARNGVEGILQTYKEIPDLIIMDVEMPLMQGYQASRLLKHRRGVNKIPIIMHTSLSDDKDKYWALNSGVDAFVNKDFENLDHILTQVNRLIQHEPFDLDIIREDGKAIDKDRVFEMLANLFNDQLFRSTILNMLGEIGRMMGSVTITVQKILDLLRKVCETHIAVIIIKYQKEPRVYLLFSDDIYQKDAEEFLSICYPDFLTQFPAMNMGDAEYSYFGLEDREDFEKLRLDNKRISSYIYTPLAGKGGNCIGTLHIGNFTNNYFSDSISNNIRIFAEGAGIVLENSVLFKQISEMQDKIRHVFSKFVPQEIINDLIEKQSDEDLMVGETRRIVILFSDIRSFTSITENNNAEAVVSFLNDHFRIMVEIIKEHGGSIDKFIGDAIFAIFGAPISYEDNALRAARAAIDMISAMDRVSTDALTLPEGGYNIGIGLHEGEAIVGNIGSSDKFDYTAIGDTVNTASRMEGLTKHYHQRILMSEEMANKVSEEFDLLEVDMVKVKGKTSSTSLYAIESPGKEYPPHIRENYEKGLKLYKLGNWDTAIEYFEKIKEELPEDKLVDIFISRCVQFKSEPPENWDGSLTLDFK